MYGKNMLNWKTIFLVIFAVLLITSASADLEFRDPKDVQFFTGIQMNEDNTITGLPQTPPADSAAVSQAYVLDNFVSTEGDVIYGDLDLNGSRIKNLPTPVAEQDAATRNYVDEEVSGITGSQNLSQVLEQDNVANQTIVFDDNTAIMIGGSTSASDQRDIVIGRSARAIESGSDSGGIIALGQNAYANSPSSQANPSLAIGQNSNATGYSTLSIGQGAKAIDSNAIAIGRSSESELDDSIAVGFNAYAGGEDAIAIGLTSSASSNDAIAIGQDASANSPHAVAIQEKSLAESDEAIAIGRESTASGEGSVAIGYNSTSPNNYETTLGNLQGQSMDLNVTGNTKIHNNLNVDGEITVGTRLTGVPNPSAGMDAVNRQYALNNFVSAEGDLVGGNLDLNGSNQIINLADPENPQDAATRNYVESYVENNSGDDQYIGNTKTHTAGGNLDMNGNNVTSSGGDMCVGKFC